jgi:hypothetical protein
MDSRRLRAYEPDELDRSVLWSWVDTYTHAYSDNYRHTPHAHSDTYLHAPHANGNGYRNASNANANGNVHFNPKTIPNSKVHSATKTSPHSCASPITSGDWREMSKARGADAGAAVFSGGDQQSGLEIARTDRI